MTELAILGGKPIRTAPIPWVNTMGNEETDAVLEVMRQGNLSAFIGRSGPGFLGGTKVQQFEEDFRNKFQAKYAISVNSATTALHTAIAACEIGPGDEVLVTPFTMVATASAILMNNAIPIFVDIDPKSFNLDPLQIERWINERTKAIVVANIFGLPANLPTIMELASKHNLYVIEDNAQSPGATINGQYAGSFGHLSIYSLNYHKIIHSGEGGVILTDDEKLARSCQLVRNHGEIVVDDLNDEHTVVLGTNYRLTELHAAIGIEQLKKLDPFLIQRRELGKLIFESLEQVPGLTGAHIPEGYTHSFYVYPILFDSEVWGITRHTLAQAMKAEGFPLGEGYQKPIYLLPMYQHKRIYNRSRYPFSLHSKLTQDYMQGLCPVAEDMFNNRLLTADICRAPYTKEDIHDFVATLHKVWENRMALVAYEKNSVLNS